MNIYAAEDGHYIGELRVRIDPGDLTLLSAIIGAPAFAAFKLGRGLFADRLRLRSMKTSDGTALRWTANGFATARLFRLCTFVPDGSWRQAMIRAFRIHDLSQGANS